MELSEILSIIYSVSFATLFSINVYSLIKINKLKKMVQQLLDRYKLLSKETDFKGIQVDINQLLEEQHESLQIINPINKTSKSQILPLDKNNEEEIYDIVNIQDKNKLEKPEEIKIEINEDSNNEKKEAVKTEVNKGFFRKFFKL